MLFILLEFFSLWTATNARSTLPSNMTNKELSRELEHAIGDAPSDIRHSIPLAGWIRKHRQKVWNELERRHGSKMGAGTGYPFSPASRIGIAARLVRDTELVSTAGMRFIDPVTGNVIKPSGRKTGSFR
jgi:hypothetical protein